MRKEQSYIFQYEQSFGTVSEEYRLRYGMISQMFTLKMKCSRSLATASHADTDGRAFPFQKSELDTPAFHNASGLPCLTYSAVS